MPISGPNGLLVLDKPAGLTSRDAVDRAQDWFPRGVKVGHTGTLDPLATGVLVLCLGSATRLADYVQKMSKVYTSTFLLGHASDTDDADGTVTRRDVDQPPSAEQLRAALQTFVGEIDQVPPAYSAAKVAGRRAYSLARQGETPELKSRRVVVYGIDLLRYEWPRLDVEVRCGKGTYIRSLARDLGERLGCGGLVEVLRRTRVGPFEAADGLSLEADRDTAMRALRPVGEAVAELPRIDLTDELTAWLRQGQALPWKSMPPGDEAAAFGARGELVAVVRLDRKRKHLWPDKVLPS